MQLQQEEKIIQVVMENRCGSNERVSRVNSCAHRWSESLSFALLLSFSQPLLGSPVQFGSVRGNEEDNFRFKSSRRSSQPRIWRRQKQRADWKQTSDKFYSSAVVEIAANRCQILPAMSESFLFKLLIFVLTFKHELLLFFMHFPLTAAVAVAVLSPIISTPVCSSCDSIESPFASFSSINFDFYLITCAARFTRKQHFFSLQKPPAPLTSLF